jgi:hypothetical protein
MPGAGGRRPPPSDLAVMITQNCGGFRGDDQPAN